MRTLSLFRVAAIVVGLLPWVLVFAPGAADFFWPTFHSLCHQRPERTLFFFGAPMVICSRCAGVYAGIAVGALLPLPALYLAHGRRLVIGAFVLTVLDVLTQDIGLHPPLHPTRLLTGFLLGWTATALLVSSLRRELRVAGLYAGTRSV